METIFALASARGKAGVAVIRVSGPEAWNAGLALCGTLPEPRRTAIRTITSLSGQTIDEALVICFADDHSFTGEKTVEFQIHGSLAVSNLLLRELGDKSGLRLAEPGEFTRRALENNRLDLARVEGLSDLIEAETEAQRRQAQRVFAGAIGQKVETWRAKLIRAAALVEAVIDFADEEVPEDVMPEVASLLDDVLPELRQEQAGTVAAERIRDGFEVAILGAPNVGKSTLLNALAGRDAALTSDIAGTTRDVIEVRMDLAGLPVTLLDTAGLRETDDQVESLGIERARARAESADLRVFLCLDGAGIEKNLQRPEDLVVQAKSDLGSGEGALAVSGKTGIGVEELISAITKNLSQQASGAGVMIRERHRIALDQAIVTLSETRDKLAVNDEEFTAEGIRAGLRQLDSLVGRVDVEHVLDEIFSSFCLGK